MKENKKKKLLKKIEAEEAAIYSIATRIDTEEKERVERGEKVGEEVTERVGKEIGEGVYKLAQSLPPSNSSSDNLSLRSGSFQPSSVISHSHTSSKTSSLSSLTSSSSIRPPLPKEEEDTSSGITDASSLDESIELESRKFLLKLIDAQSINPPLIDNHPTHSSTLDTSQVNNHYHIHCCNHSLPGREISAHQNSNQFSTPLNQPLNQLIILNQIY